MNVVELIAELQTAGVRLHLRDGELKAQARNGALTRDVVERIRDAKALIVEHLTQLETAKSAASIALGPPIAEGERVAATPQQRRLAYVAETGEGRAYHIVRAFRLSPDTDPDRLIDALRATVDAHPALRTVFEREDDLLFQRAIPTHPGAIERLLDANATVVDAIVDRFAGTPIDLEAGPLFRAVVATGEVGCALIFVVHHAVTDGASLDLLFGEIALRYRGESPVPPERHYPDYAAYRPRQYAAGPHDADRSYWREAMRGVRREEIVDGDIDPRAPATALARRVRSTLDAASTARFRKLLAEARVSPFVGALALLNACVMRYTGAEDVCVGTVSLNRPSPDFGRTLGFFASTFVVRVSMPSQTRFREALHVCRDGLLAALEHQEYPLEQVARIAREEGEVEHGLPFQIVLAFEDKSRPLPAIAGVVPAERETSQPYAKFDLCLIVVDRGETLEFAWEYREGRFGADFMRRLSENFATLIASAVDGPDRPLSELEILGETDAERLENDLRIVGDAYPRDRTVHGLVADAAAANPDAVALVHRERRIRYRELDRRAGDVAATLMRHGLRPGDRVGVAMSRSPEQIVACLGVMKAGAAYVPMDPDLPPARLDAMREDVGMTLCLVANEVPAALRDLPLRTIAMTAVDECAPAESPAATTPAANAESPCYVLFSSGSTGRPKGIACRHRGVVRLAYEPRVQIGADTVSLVSASMNFDASTLEIWPTLIHGGRCVLYPEAVLDPRAVAGVVAGEGVNFVVLTAALFSALADVAPSCFRGIRDIVVGGDAFPVEAGQRVLEAVPSIALHNGYGPTEATVFCTVHRVVNDPGLRRVPIGRPTAHDAVLVLDANGRPLPYGAAGELCVFGDGIAAGYVANPALDAERFIEHPLCGGRSRLYRTGDIARWRDDGALEFLGRRDHQVKINGMRIELDEIAAVLATHPQVRRCLVRAPSDGGRGHRRLIAYYVPSTSGDVDAASLAAHLERSLPPHMVPRSYVALDAIPLNINGKVDEKRLPSPASPDASEAHADEMQGDTERALLALWREALGVERIGRDGRFYALGGHSLMAVRLIGRINRAFGTGVTVAQFMSDATIAALARRIEAQRTEASVATIPRHARETDLVPLSAAQRSLWLHQQLSPTSTAYNVPIAWRIRGPLDAGRLEKAIGTVVARHEPLRSLFVDVDGRPFQRVLLPGPPALEVRQANEAALQREIRSATARVHDLEREPAFRACLMRLDENDHALLIEMHHLVFDGWSMAVLCRELSAAYAGEPAAGGDESPLRYSDYCFQQDSDEFGERMARGRAYWRTELHEAPTSFSLPVGVVARQEGEPEAGTVAGYLPQALRARIERFARVRGCSAFAVFMAGFSALLHRLGAVDDLVVGTPAANRNERGLESLIGYFVNPLPLRTRVSSEVGFDAFLARVDDALRGGLEHQFVPLDEIVAALGIGRVEGRPPVFQVLFDYRREESTGPVFGDAEVEGIRTPASAPKYDLLFGIEDRLDDCGLSLTYRSDLYDAETMARLLDGYLALLDDALAEPSKPVLRLRVLDDAERALVAASASGVATGPAPPVLDAILARAAAAPDAVALRWRDRSVTCRELASEVDRVAHALVAEGVAAGDTVALAMERSPALVATMLGCLRAGAAYIPLEPGYPRDRLAHVLGESSARLLVVDDSGLAAIGDDAVAVPVRTFDALSVRVDVSATATLPALHPDMPAYVIYTSGSTGKPKGVVVAHGALANHMMWMIREFDFSRDDRFLFKTPSGFDASVWEVYAPLMCGATMVIAPGNDHRDPFALLDLIERERASVAQFVPSLLRACLDAREGASLPPSLRWVFCGGEPFPRSLLDDAQCAAPGAVMANLYGPTEATIDATFWRSDRDAAGESATVPIGRPIDNVVCEVLDAMGRRVPRGIEGELFIAGAGLALGYLNAPEATAERFVEIDPDGEAPVRAYATGDIVRRAGDGQLVFVRRRDAQVKVRGHRIELEEIDAALRRLPGVRDAICVVRDESGRGAQLVAFVVPTDERDVARDIDPDGFAEPLRRSLPEYMVPSRYVAIDAVPTTPNGKADRGLLERMPLERSVEHERAAETATEREVAEIWREVLALDASPSAVADFYRLGGHSLSATQVVARAHRRYGVRIPLQDFLRTPTVERLATLIEEGARLAAIASRGREEPGADAAAEEQREEFIL